MKTLKLISVLWILIITSYSYSQTISGSVKFQSDRTDYTWTFVEVDGVFFEVTVFILKSMFWRAAQNP